MTETILKLFIPVITAYIMAKTGYLKRTLSGELKTLVVRVCVPPLVFMSMYNTDMETIKQFIPVSSAYVVLTALLLILTTLIFIPLKDMKTKAAYIITIVWGNYGWMGWAVLREAYGETGFSRGIFFTAFWWPVLYMGAFLVRYICRLETGQLDIKNYITNMLTSTGALILGITFNLTNTELPETVTYALNSFGHMTVTLILFSVGLTISVRESLKYLKRSLPAVILRPLLGVIGGFFTIMILNITDPVSRNSIIVESMMPVAIFTVVIGDMLGLDGKLTSSILVLSTLLSLITIPLSLMIV